MGYKHFGETVEIWIHFPLCDVVKILQYEKDWNGNIDSFCNIFL